MLRIGIDVTAAVTGSTGIARYVTEVARRLDHEVGVVRFAIGRGVHPPPPGTRHLRLPLRAFDRLWSTVDRPPVEALVGDLTSLHASGPLLPPSRRPTVAVVHDLAPLLHPELHPARDVGQLQRYVARLRRADAVIAVSGATGERIADTGVSAERIHVVPNGLTELPPPVAPPLAGRRFVLAVGAPVPRKGFDDLLRAVARLDDPELRVAIVGPTGPEDDELVRLAGALGIGDRVHRAGPVSLAELAGWYCTASVVAVPSIDEGFGLPVIEALSVGTPVVASDIGAFREVAGGHAQLVPVGDLDALAAALEAAAAGPRDDPAAVAHARRFSWDACAADTLAVHRLVAS